MMSDIQPISAKPTYIKHIKIERLFGYLSYDLPFTTRSDPNIDRLMILYGDNGSGKTTILTLLFCLLSPVGQRGEKTYIARTPFKHFEIEFDEGTIVSATRSGEQLIGSYAVTIHQPHSDREIFPIMVDAENAVAAPPSEATRSLLIRLSRLGVNLYFLPDDRRVRTTISTESDHVSPQIVDPSQLYLFDPDSDAPAVMRPWREHR